MATFEQLLDWYESWHLAIIADSGAVCARAAFDGCLNAVVRHTAAQRSVHGVADLRIGGMRIFVEQRLCRHDLPVLAESTLRDLLVHPRLLERVQLAVRREPFECGDFTLDGGHGQNAGTNSR
jgi:hypothetical protein